MIDAEIFVVGFLGGMAVTLAAQAIVWWAVDE